MKRIVQLLLGAATGIAVLHLIIITPQMRRNFIRKYVGSKVVEIVKTKDGKPIGGGTGFGIKAPSGREYIMTNAHVCSAFKDEDPTVLLPNGSMVKRKILSISDTTDLCLIEGVTGLGALELGKSVYIGETIMIVGHPLLMPLAVSEGDIIDLKVNEIGLGIIGEEILEKNCRLPKNKIVEVQYGFFGTVPVCMEEIMSYQTTAQSLPGSSGSPVVNKEGQVIGVNFAGDELVHWGISVPLEDVKKFLAGQ